MFRKKIGSIFTALNKTNYLTLKIDKMTPSIYQAAIYNFATNGQGNAVVNAVAGSGKSTTLVEMLNILPKDRKILFVAFNKEIVEELIVKTFSSKDEVNEIGRSNAIAIATTRMKASNITIQTLHSLGFGVLRYANKSIKLDNFKYRAYLKDNFYALKPDFSSETSDLGDYQKKVLSLVDLGRVNLCKTDDELVDIAFKHNIELENGECELALKVINWGTRQTETIDFTDMIYLPIVKEMRCFTYDFVFVDECQDLNACQRELFLKMLTPRTGRFIAVGDPHQAIYGFAGADAESFTLLRNIPNTIELPLSVCYRCSTSIIDLAQNIVPQIQARPGATEGVVNREASLQEVAVGDMVLCRLTAPLVELCFSYISKGIPAYVKGRDIATNLTNMIDKTRKYKLEEMFICLDIESRKLLSTICRKQRIEVSEAESTPVFQSFEDRVQCLEVLSAGLENIDELKARIQKIFADEKEGIIFSTVHRSKGLENEKVFIVCPDRLPLKRKGMKAWQHEQEKNLEYVAYTRAKNYLGIIVDYNYRNN